MEKQTFIAYGFEYDDKIYYNNGLILCKSVQTKNPVYSSVIFKSNLDCDILQTIRNLEKKNYFQISEVNRFAKVKRVMPRWQTVYYSKNLLFDCGFESEGDENGDPR